MGSLHVYDTVELRRCCERIDSLDKVSNWTPMKSFGLPEEIADGIVWLLSRRSNFATDSALAMDERYLAQ